MHWESLVIKWKKRQKQGRSLFWILLLFITVLMTITPFRYVEAAKQYNFDTPTDDLYIYETDFEQMRHAFLKFNISSLPAGRTVVSATITVYVMDWGSDASSHAAYRVADQTWTEDTDAEVLDDLTFDNDEIFGSQLNGIGYRDIPVTTPLNASYMDSYSNASFFLVDLSSGYNPSEGYAKNATEDYIWFGSGVYDGYKFASREHATYDPPKLTVNFQAAPSVDAVYEVPPNILPWYDNHLCVNVSDTDGREDIVYVHLKLTHENGSYSHIRWNEASKGFSQISGSDAIEMGWTDWEVIDANSYWLYFGFRSKWGWLGSFTVTHNVTVTDDDGLYDTDLSQKSWFTSQLWIYDADWHALRTAGGAPYYIEADNWDSLAGTNRLNVSGHVYWYNTTVSYEDSPFDPPVEVVMEINGTDMETQTNTTWLSPWTFRMWHNISTSANVTYMPIKIIVRRWGSGWYENIGQLYTGAHNDRSETCKADFSDIRFTGADGVSPIYATYLAGIEEDPDEEYYNATFWIRRGVNTAQDTRIYMYYGNPNATLLSACTSVFGYNAQWPHSLADRFWWGWEGYNLTNSGYFSSETRGARIKQEGRPEWPEDTDDHGAQVNGTSVFPLEDDGTENQANYWIISAPLETSLYNESAAANVTEGDYSLKVVWTPGFPSTGTEISLLNTTGPRWLDGWNYRKLHTINGSTVGVLSDYVMQINVYNTSGADSGNNVYIGSKGATDFGDIRFTDGDGETKLDYWMGEKFSNRARFWVEIPSIPASPSTTNIFIYYNRTGVSTSSNGTNTFLFFDDFSGDLSAWSGDTAVFTIVGGELRCAHQTGGDEGAIYPTGVSEDGVAVEVQAKISPTEQAWLGLRKEWVEGNVSYTHYGYQMLQRRQQTDIWLVEGTYTGFQSLNATATQYDDLYHLSSFRMYGDDMTGYRWANGTTKYEVTYTDTTHDSGLVYLGGQRSGSNYVWFDDFRVREYVEPEPIHGTWGAERTPYFAWSAFREFSVGFKPDVNCDADTLNDVRFELHDSVNSRACYAELRADWGNWTVDTWNYYVITKEDFEEGGSPYYFSNLQETDWIDKYVFTYTAGMDNKTVELTVDGWAIDVNDVSARKRIIYNVTEEGYATDMNWTTGIWLRRNGATNETGEVIWDTPFNDLTDWTESESPPNRSVSISTTQYHSSPSSAYFYVEKDTDGEAGITSDFTDQPDGKWVFQYRIYIDSLGTTTVFTGSPTFDILMRDQGEGQYFIWQTFINHPTEGVQFGSMFGGGVGWETIATGLELDTWYVVVDNINLDVETYNAMLFDSYGNELGSYDGAAVEGSLIDRIRIRGYNFGGETDDCKVYLDDLVFAPRDVGFFNFQENETVIVKVRIQDGHYQWYNTSGWYNFTPDFSMIQDQWYFMEFQIDSSGLELIANGTYYIGDIVNNVTTELNYWCLQAGGNGFSGDWSFDDWFITCFTHWGGEFDERYGGVVDHGSTGSWDMDWAYKFYNYLDEEVYQASVDDYGRFTFPYFGVPSTPDLDWSVDIRLEELTSQMTAGPSNVVTKRYLSINDTEFVTTTERKGGNAGIIEYLGSTAYGWDVSSGTGVDLVWVNATDSHEFGWFCSVDLSGYMNTTYAIDSVNIKRYYDHIHGGAWDENDGIMIRAFNTTVNVGSGGDTDWDTAQEVVDHIVAGDFFAGNVTAMGRAAEQFHIFPDAWLEEWLNLTSPYGEGRFTYWMSQVGLDEPQEPTHHGWRAASSDISLIIRHRKYDISANSISSPFAANETFYPGHNHSVSVLVGGVGTNIAPTHRDEGTEGNAASWTGPSEFSDDSDEESVLFGDYSLDAFFDPGIAMESHTNQYTLPTPFQYDGFQKMELSMLIDELGDNDSLTDLGIKLIATAPSPDHVMWWRFRAAWNNWTVDEWNDLILTEANSYTVPDPLEAGDVVNKILLEFQAGQDRQDIHIWFDGWDIYAGGNSEIETIWVYMSPYGNTTDAYGFYFNEASETAGEAYGANLGVLLGGTFTRDIPSVGDISVTFNFSMNWTWVEQTGDASNISASTRLRITSQSIETDIGVNSSWFNKEYDWGYENDIQLYDLNAQYYSDGWWEIADESWVKTNSSLRVFGHYYMNNTVIAPGIQFGAPVVGLTIDGVDLGATYNASTTSTGYFLINTYTTPEAQDWDWSINVTVSVPTGGGVGGALNDGFFGLLLFNYPPPQSLTMTGISVTVIFQPGNIIPAGVLNPARLIIGSLRSLEENDGDELGTTSGTGHTYMSFWWEVGYWNQTDMLIYDMWGAGGEAGTEDIHLYDYHPAETLVDTQTADNPSIMGAHAINATNFNDARMDVFIHLENTVSTSYLRFDQLVLNFTSFSASYQTERVINETAVYDVLTFQVLQDDVNVTITGISNEYILREITPAGGYEGYINNILSQGNLTLYGCSAGIFQITFNTTMTYHAVSFRAGLPDGLEEQWDTFAWYVNYSRVADNPYPMTHGVWEVVVKDYFEQTIYSENVTILSTDQREFTIEFILPVYSVGIKNEDRESYYLNITRNLITSQQPLPPLGEVHFRVYGVVPSANYTVQVLKSADDSLVGQFTLSVPDHAISEIVDYVQEEDVDFVAVFPSAIEVDQNLTVSGWVFWTNGTAITSFNAYVDWGSGDEAISTIGTNFYGSHFYNTTGTKQFNVTVEVAGQVNETRTYLVNVEESRFSDAPLMAIDFLPAQAEVNEPVVVFGAIHYATGDPAQGDVTIYWGDYASENVTLSLGTLRATHTYGITGNYLIAVKFPLSGTDYWYNTTYTIIPNPMGTQGNLQLFTDSDDTIRVYTVNQLSGGVSGYQITEGSSVNLNLDSSNFDLLEQLETDGVITFQDSWEDGDWTSNPTWDITGNDPTISSDSAFGSYSLAIDHPSANEIICYNDANGFNTTKQADYLIIVLKTEGVQEADEYFIINVWDVGGAEEVRVYVNNQGRRTGWEWVNVPEGEWVILTLNMKDIWKRIRGTDFSTVDRFRLWQEDDGGDDGSSTTYVDLVAWTNDPSVLFASEYAIHAFSQSGGDHAIDTFGDMWDFQEDEEDFSSTDTGYGGKLRYHSDGCLVTQSLGGGTTYVNIASIGEPSWGSSIDLDADKYKWMQAKVKTNDTDDFYFQIWAYNGTDWDATLWHDVRYSGIADQWQIFTWDMSQDSNWMGIITGLQFRADNDPDNMTANVMFWIDYIMFTIDDPRDFTKYQSTTVDLLDGGQQVTFFPEGTLLIDSGLAGDTRAIVTNAIGASTEYTVEDSALTLDLVFDPFESYATEFDNNVEKEEWVFENSGSWSIASGSLNYDGTGSSWQEAYYKDLQIEDGEIEAEVIIHSGSTQAGMIFRVQDLQNFYHTFLRQDLDRWYFYKCVDGDFIYFTYRDISNNLGYSLSLDTVYTMKVRFYDNYFEFSLNNELLFIYDDSTFLSAGFVGVSVFDTVEADYHSLKMTSLPDSRDYTILGLESGTKEYFYDERGDVLDYSEDLEGSIPYYHLERYWDTDYNIIVHNASTGIEQSDSYSDNAIDTSIYTHMAVRVMVFEESDNDYIFQFRVATWAVVWESADLVDKGTWYELVGDVSSDPDWTGTETTLRLWERNLQSNSTVFHDCAFILSDEDYDYERVQLDQPRIVVLFPGYSDVPIMAVAFPETGKVGTPINVYGAVYYANGTAATENVAIYWGNGDLTSESLTDGRFVAAYTYGITGTYDIGVQFTLRGVNYWQNGTVIIGPSDPTAPGNLQLATDYTDPVSIFTINQLSGDLMEYQTVTGTSVNLDLGLSNFDLLDQFRSDGDVTFRDSFEDGDSTSDPTWDTYGDSRGEISSISAFGDYSWRINSNGGGDGIDIDTDSFVDSDYMIVVVKVDGTMTSNKERPIIYIKNSNNNYLCYNFWVNGETMWSTSTYRHINLQMNFNEWNIFVLAWREDYNSYFGAYPSGTQKLYLADQDELTGSNLQSYYDLITFTDDPSLLFGSEYTIHGFAQGESDYAMSVLGDAWDFQEDVEGFTISWATDYASNGYLTLENDTTGAYLRIEYLGSIDADLYPIIQLRAKSNITGNIGVRVYDADNNIVGGKQTFDCADQWQIFTWNTLGADWTGVESGVRFYVVDFDVVGSIKVDIDWILFTTYDPADFTKYQSTTIDLLDGTQQVTVFPTERLLMDSGLAGDTRALVTNAVGSTTEYAIEGSALAIELPYNSFESYNTEFDDSAEIDDWVSFGNSATWTISNGKLVMSGGTSDCAAYYKHLQVEDGEVVANIYVGDPAGVFVGFVFRLQDPRNYYEFYMSFNKVNLVKRVAGTRTAVSTQDYTLTAYQTYEFKLRFYDSYIEGYIDDVLYFVYSDTTFLSAGYIGAFDYQYKSNTFFDFAVTSLPDSRDYQILGLEADTKEYFYDEMGNMKDWSDEDSVTFQPESTGYWDSDLQTTMHDSGDFTIYHFGSLSIDSDVYEYGAIRFRVINETADTYNVMFEDSGYNSISTPVEYTDTDFHVYEGDFSEDADWTGTETSLKGVFYSLATNAWISVDYVLLLSDEDYSYKSTQLDQPRALILFPGAQNTERLELFAPAEVPVDITFAMTGYLFWNNGTAIDTTGSAITIAWGDTSSDQVDATNGIFSGTHAYTTIGTKTVQVTYGTLTATTQISVREALAGEIPQAIIIESYWFDKDDATYIFITLTTNQGDCSVNVTENGTPKLTAQSETVRLVYAKATIPGYYNVTVEVYKSGFATVTIFSSYTVLAETFYVRDFEYGVNDEFFFLLLDSSWDNATVDVWIIAVSPNGTLTKVLEGVDENVLLQWKITNDERQARYVYVYAKISGSLTQYEWRNFTYSYRIPLKEALSNINFPAYRQEFDALKQNMVGMNQLMMIGFVGLVLAMVFQSRAWGREFFEKPMVRTNRRKKKR